MLEFFTVYRRDIAPSGAVKRRRPLNRNHVGSQMAEFAAALSLLLAFIFLPLLDLAIVPVRWMTAQELVNTYTRNLAMCETHSQALCALEADPSLRDRLQKIGGINVSSTDLHLSITRISTNHETSKSIEIHKPGTIPADWLPDGAFAPCQYSLVLEVKASVSPAVLLNWGTLAVPGLTQPIPISIVVLHDWGNLGRDPASEKFFMNE